MKRSLSLPIALLALAIALAACAGGDGGEAVNGVDGEQPSTTPGEPDDEPTAFDALRDELRDRLMAIGASIGSTPNDVREGLIESCLDLAEYVDMERVEPICRDIEDAIDAGDPGKIERILDHLAALEME